MLHLPAGGFPSCAPPRGCAALGSGPGLEPGGSPRASGRAVPGPGSGRAAPARAGVAEAWRATQARQIARELEQSWGPKSRPPRALAAQHLCAGSALTASRGRRQPPAGDPARDGVRGEHESQAGRAVGANQCESAEKLDSKRPPLSQRARNPRGHVVRGIECTGGPGWVYNGQQWPRRVSCFPVQPSFANDRSNALWTARRLANGLLSASARGAFRARADAMKLVATRLLAASGGLLSSCGRSALHQLPQHVC